MRIDVKKFLFVGLRIDKSPFFTAAQQLGVMQFIEQKPKESDDPQVSLYTSAIKVVRGLPPVGQEELGDAPSVAEEVLRQHKALEKVREELRVISLDISRIKIFGSFSMEDVRYIEERGRLLQFFTSKKGMAEKHEELIYIASEHGLDYFVAINSAPKSYPGMIEMKIDHSLPELEEQLNQKNQEKKSLEKRLHTLARFSNLLHHALAQALNRAHLQRAENSTQNPLQGIFAATAWIPVDKVEQVASLAQKQHVYVEEVAIDPQDTVPTYLENENLGRIGQDLVAIYDTPSTTDKDPSLWVLFGFLLFFSIIIGDGGYGSVFLGLALYIRYKFPNLRAAQKRLLNLFTMLCVGCIAWGVLTSSFFGISLNPDNPLRRFSLLSYLAEKKIEYHKARNDAFYQSWLEDYPRMHPELSAKEILHHGYNEKQGHKVYELLNTLSDEILMELALFIGVVHIILGLLRYLRRNFSNLGWILFLVGSYLYFPVFLGVPSLLNYLLGIPFEAGGAVGLQLIYTGIPLALLLAIFKHGLLGLTEIMNLIQVFADALSYLRLYALGLSGSILSVTINDIASYLPFLLALVLIIAAHLVNMLLGIMGGVIHGLRLNFLEWYHYSFEGGGRAFKPLKLQEKES